MRVARRNVVLGLALAALVAANLVGPQRSSGPAREIARLNPALVPSEATRFELVGAGRAVVATRVDGRWVLPDLFDHPADGALLDRVLTRFAELTTLDLLTEDAARHAEYGLEEERAQRVTALGARGEQVLDVLLARSSTSQSYVRRSGEAAVYGAGALPDTSSDVQVWRAMQALVDVDAALVTRFELSGPALGDGAAPRVVARAEGRFDRWLDADGRDVRRDLADGLVRDLTRLFPERVLAGAPAPEHGLDSPWLTIRVKDARGGEHAAAIARPAAAPVTAVGSSGPWVVALPARSVDALGERVRALTR